jgi:tRNA threonylcarbamoyladenosine dehydratase
VSQPQRPGAQAGAGDAAAPAAGRVPAGSDGDADLERRFGGLRRLYGEAGYASVRAGRVAVVGLGGVGSWAAEALARSGVARLVLIDLDHVAESNINRQVQALSSTLGQAKVQALCARIAQIHPACEVLGVEDFVTETNWPALLPAPVDVLIDACDQVRAKASLAAWALASGTPLVCVGAAGGRERPDQVEVADLAGVTHDPLLAALRQRLRQSRRRAGLAVPAGPWGLRCVFSREALVQPPTAACAPGVEAQPSGTAAAVFTPGLNCAGYGSSVMVTACFGLVAAAEAVAVLRRVPTAAPLPPLPRAARDSRAVATG